MVGRLTRSVVAMILATIAFSLGTVAYEKDPYIVKVVGPRGQVACERSVELTATVLNADTLKPIRQQIVQWQISDGSGRDRLSQSRTKTDAKGRTSVGLYIGQALGDRRVTASAASVPGRITIQVRCVLPTPRPTPPPEKTPRPTRTARPSDAPTLGSLTIAHRAADLGGMAPLLLAQTQGFFGDAGFADVTLQHLPDGLAALRDGTADLAVVSLDEALGAIGAGEPVVIVSGYRNYRSNVVAVASGISGPQDLAGQPVILGEEGSAERELQLAALREAGWDLETVGAVPVSVDGGPDAWAEALLAGDVLLAPILNRHRQLVDQAGGTVVVDIRGYGNEVVVAPTALLEGSPDTVRGFQEALVRALQALSEPSSDEALFAAAEAAGIPAADAVRNGWRLDLEEFQALDGGLGLVEFGGGLAELHELLAERGLVLPAFADHLALESLNAVQAELDLVPNPMIEPLPAPMITQLRVGTSSTSFGDRGPLLLAQALGAFGTAGFERVDLVESLDALGEVAEGSLDIAVADRVDAQEAVAADPRLSIIAGYAGPGADGEEATVLVADVERLDEATLAAFLAATLRGFGGLQAPDAFEIATTQAGGPTEDDITAWDQAVARFAPYDGSLGTVDATGADLAALDAARRSLGMPGVIEEVG